MSNVDAKTKNKPEWELLEIIVADIQKQLAPKAEVRHNHKVVGKSGRKRKLDVTVSQKVGTSPIFIIFDCKWHKRTVKLKDVAAFAEQIDDVAATLGVMVSNIGFDAGARAVARKSNILLQTYRKARETDWNSLLGEQAWVFLSKVEFRNLHIMATIPGESQQKQIPIETIFYAENGEVLGTLETVFWDIWNQNGQPCGDFEGQIDFDGSPYFIRDNDHLAQIKAATINGRLVPIKYVINWQLAQGDIIENEDRTEPIYRSLVSHGIDWAEIANNMTGIEITPEEHQQILNASNCSFNLRHAKRYIRIVVQDKGESHVQQ